jgi:hypothetical protein
MLLTSTVLIDLRFIQWYILLVYGAKCTNVYTLR